MVMLEAPLRTAMYEYSRNILALSLVISIITAGLIYITLHWLLIRPIRAITHSMVRFRTAPEDTENIIIPSQRSDEVGTAETELAAMQQVVRQALQQKKHLTELGGAVSRISHDLRNILAHAQLVSDRLSALKDPTVRQLTPGLIQSIGRAIDLCTDTLSYSRADS
ncbi:MAG TPA: histidine kinase, partial [Alphaproteobacteria bacterium]|nr:histidine kinase [Alphaproteobacteria bacterium]